jgi:uncharacterized protein DUF6644
MGPLIRWLVDTPVNSFVMDYRWVWPICESLHFCSLTVMAGTVGLFDLRVLGLAKGIAPGALHRIVRWGVVAFVVSFCTGLMFIFGQPDQYFYNNAFKVKVVCLVLMGANVLAFYSLEFASVRALGPNDDAPTRAKVFAGFSLLILVCVICAGRMLTFFRPPY